MLTDNTPDNSSDNQQNQPEKNFFYIEDLKNKFGVSRDTVYSWARHLGLKWNRHNGKTCLTAQQVEWMERLSLHIQEHRTMEGCPLPDNLENSSPHVGVRNDTEDNSDNSDSTAITIHRGLLNEGNPRTATSHQNQSELAAPAQHNSELAAPGQHNQLSTPQQQTDPLQPDPFTQTVHRQQPLPDIENPDEIFASAQNLAAGRMIAERLLAQEYLANPEKLPEELQQQIREAGRVGRIDPLAYAKSLLRLAGKEVA